MSEQDLNQVDQFSSAVIVVQLFISETLTKLTIGLCLFICINRTNVYLFICVCVCVCLS